ncbi:MAG TPA: hypothetical protein VHW71_01180 [Steroidobacteraceae bacterium]|jgi:hypothetical protein|nr:hypothetical protein [Steroidobacteraceae bacterium]
MKRGMVLARRWAVGAALLLAACAAAPPKPPAPPPAAPPPAALPLDPSYDWHVLLAAPFGSVLKDVPLTMHEVLLFRDEQHRAASADELECYAVDDSRPRFLARSPSEYLLCFRHDRLSRIEAMVPLPADRAAQIFSDACGLWMKNEQAGTQGCVGSSGGIAFSGHLESEAEGSQQLMTVQLDAPEPASEHAAER